MLISSPVSFLSLLGVAALLIPTRVQAVGALKIAFDNEGLSSAKVGEEEFLTSGAPVATWVTGEDGKPMGGKSASGAFDAASKTTTVTYAWGTLTCRYEAIADGLRIYAAVTNSGQQKLTGVRMNLLTLKSLGEGKTQQPTFCVEKPTFTFFKGSAGTAVLGVENQKFPIALDFAVDAKKGAVNPRAAFGGGRVVVDGVQLNETLAPGEKFEFQFVLRVGAAGSDPMVLAADFLDAFRKSHPAALVWKDRRPILRSFFGGGLPKDQALANLKDPGSVVAPAPDEKFRAMILNKFDGMVEAAKAVNAQGLLLWDLEGGTFPHATTYIGDPRLIRILNPQMELVADEGIKKLKDAGLNVGVTLRPSRVIYDAAKNDARHSYTDAGDAFSELDAKVAYCRERWGCKLFYVDTNFFWRPYGAEKKWQSGPISADVWRKLFSKYPDTLFIPEFTETADYASVAGYGEADMGDYGMPAIAAALYPEAFRVIVIEDADASENFDRFVSALAGRNVLMTFGQSATAHNVVMIQRMEQTLALQKSPVPAAVSSASPAELVKLLSSSDAAVRFQAVRRLTMEPSEQAGPRLLELVQADDEQWPVRRAAVVALGKMSYAAAIPALFNLLDDRSQGLYGDAAKALVGQDATVEELALEKIRNAPGGKNKSNVYELTGAVLVLRKAAGRAPALQEIFNNMPESDQQNRKALIGLIGELRNPESEAFLLPFLADPYYAPSAAIALVRIGSENGLAQVKTALQTAKSAGNKQLADALGRALQAK